MPDAPAPAPNPHPTLAPNANPPDATGSGLAQASSPDAAGDERLRALATALEVPLRLDAAYGPQADLPPVSAARLAAGFATPLLDLGLLAVTGDEALKFLHSQLTNDVEHLGEDEARWYGYCTAKGRLLSTCLGWRQTDGVALTVSRPTAESLRKRLSMFVLRARAKVLDRSDEVVLFGLGGGSGAAASALAALGVGTPGPMSVARGGDLVAVGLPAVGFADASLGRWLLAVPRERAADCWQTLRAALAPAPTSAWRWTEVLAGIPRIVPGTSEQFVPQMLNFEVVGGVNFKKGCYPGQEVVARSQYLGKLKRRMYAAHLDGAEPAPGSDVVPAAGGEPSGQVVLAAPAPDGGFELLFESQTAAVEAGALTAGGASLQLFDLPYALPA